jgi:hypothetical protein
MAIEGAIVTVDTIGCHCSIAKKIINKKTDDAQWRQSRSTSPCGRARDCWLTRERVIASLRNPSRTSEKRARNRNLQDGLICMVIDYTNHRAHRARFFSFGEEPVLDAPKTVRRAELGRRTGCVFAR